MNKITSICFSNLYIKKYLINCRKLSDRSIISLYNLSSVVSFHSAPKLLAGHSKWANIRHIKALKDGQKATAFTKLSRQIRLAIQEGGSSNPVLNSSLKSAIEEATRKNMPMSTIQNNIKKFEANKTQIKKHFLEIKFSKIFMVCILYTDNFATLKMNLAPILKKAKASYGDAMHLFEDMGVIETIAKDDLKSKPNTLEEHCTDDAIECGAEEVEVIDAEKGIVNFLCNPIELTRISKDLGNKGYQIESAEHVFVPKTVITAPENDIKAYEVLKEKLMAADGLEQIYDNLDPSLES